MEMRKERCDAYVNNMRGLSIEDNTAQAKAIINIATNGEEETVARRAFELQVVGLW